MILKHFHIDSQIKKEMNNEMLDYYYENSRIETHLLYKISTLIRGKYTKLDRSNSQKLAAINS